MVSKRFEKLLGSRKSNEKESITASISTKIQIPLIFKSYIALHERFGLKDSLKAIKESQYFQVA